VLLRREALARWCWEKFEAFSLRPHEGSAMHAAVLAYDWTRASKQALPRWLDEQTEVMLLHELGERKAGDWLGPAGTRCAWPCQPPRRPVCARRARPPGRSGNHPAHAAGT
jgi:hypothetical protein